jgi:hypothetical protein
MQMQMHVYLILASGTQFRITDFRIGLGFASNAAVLCIVFDLHILSPLFIRSPIPVKI